VIDLVAADILKLVARGESETVEFKETFNDEALETIGALSNAKGGMILVGVKDSGEICGFQIGKKTIEDIANRIQDVSDPRLQPSITTLHYEKKNILAIQIYPSSRVPVSIRGRFFRRSGRTNQRMSHEEIMQRMAANTGLSWDAFIETGATLNDLDSDLIKRFIQAANKLGRRPAPKQTSEQEFLRKLDLIQDGSLTRAAILLFGKNPNSYFPSGFLKIGRFRSPTTIVDDREVHGALIKQLDEAMNWFRDRLETEFVIVGKPEREVHWEYPLSAIREAVINVLCHRDYTSGAHSQIRLYDNRLEIWNAGSLPPSLTPDLLFQEHDSIPRNRKIAEVFFYMGLIERWGSGTLRIVEELEKANLPRPEFVSEPGRFRLVFRKELFTDERLQELELSERQLKAIAFVKSRGHISNTEYQDVTGVSKRTATRELNELISKDVLVSEGGPRGRGRVYRLKTI
jgi:ATP-dependent DNA helicase RecG